MSCVFIFRSGAEAGFITAPTYAVTHPVSVAVGDFNGDGIPDLVVANETENSQNPGTVSILLGNGDGTFQAAQSYGLAINPVSVAVGDFNGDGHVDLAAAGSSGVSILLGNGDGTFQAAQDYAAGLGAGSVAVADFNGDGILDLATANRGLGLVMGNTVSVLLGRGDGTFQAAQSYAVGNTPVSVAVGDFNGDGIADLVAANGNSGTVSVLLGNGDGSFQPARSYATVGFYPSSVAIGDFNGDGHIDLAATAGLVGGISNVSILLGNGDGTFQPAKAYVVGANPRSVAVGDFNRDGHLDLAVGGGSGVTVLLGNGDGTFQAARNYAAGISDGFGYPVAAADLNRDGRLDLVVANSGDFQLSNGSLSALLGNGDGTFQAARSYDVGLAVGLNSDVDDQMAVADFNGDGIPDLAVVSYRETTITVLLGNGDGTFRVGSVLPAGSGPQSIAVGDFNGDGKVDLVTRNFNTTRYGEVIEDDLRFFAGNGDGTFQRARISRVGRGGYGISLAVADFNGDGRLDLALAVSSSIASPASLSILLGNGDGTFATSLINMPGLGLLSVGVADFNGDGVPDLAVANSGSSDTVSVLLGNGDGTFQAAETYPAGGEPFSMAVADFNGDGHLDLAVTFNSGTINVFLGNGDGSLQAPQSYAVGIRWRLAVGDFNGDGIPDVAGIANSGVAVSLGNGDGSFQAGQSFAAGPTDLGAVLAADFNQDGFADLAVANPYVVGMLTVLINAADWGGH